MRARLLLSFLAAALLSAATLSGQDWRGKGRVDGHVKDAGGQPIADAKVELTRDSGGGPSTKTDKKGYWAVMGLIGGKWNVDISAPGYETRKTVVGVQEAGRNSPLAPMARRRRVPETISSRKLAPCRSRNPRT